MPFHYGEFRVGVEIGGVAPGDFASGQSNHFFEAAIDVENVVAIVRNQHAFVQGVEDALGLQQPLRLFDVQEILFSSWQRANTYLTATLAADENGSGAVE